MITAYQPTLLLFQVHLKTVNLVDAPIHVALVVPYPLLDRIIRSLGQDFLTGTCNALGKIGLCSFPDLPPSTISSLNYSLLQLSQNLSDVWCALTPLSSGFIRQYTHIINDQSLMCLPNILKNVSLVRYIYQLNLCVVSCANCNSYILCQCFDSLH